MTAHLRINNAWKSIKEIKLRKDNAWKNITKAYIRVSGAWKLFFSGNAPIQITKPTLTGTGVVGTTLTRSSGTYSNYNSLITRIFYTTDTGDQDSGSTFDPSGGNVTATNPYTVLQADAATPPNYFYARDQVLGIDNQTYYYYSTPSIKAEIPPFQDNFNRTVASGLGTASGGFIYSGPSRNNATWSVNGSRAVNNSGSQYPMKTVDSGSFNQSISVDTFGGGLGVAVWVDSTSSFWSVIPDYEYVSEQAFSYECDSNITYVLNPETEDCPPLATLGSNPQSPGYTSNDVGLRCSACTTSTTNVTTSQCPTGEIYVITSTCPDFGSLGGDRCTVCQEISSTASVLTCSGSSSGSSCPGTGSGVGQRCSACNSTAVCTGSQVSTSCPDYGPNVGDRCGSCSGEPETVLVLTCSGSSSGSSCPGTGSSVGQRCGACNSVAICTGSTTTSSCPDTGPNVGDRCGACSTNIDSYDVITCSGSNSGGSCPGTGSSVGQRCSSCSSSTSTSNLCTGSSSSASCPDTGPQAGDRCGACSPSTSTSYSCTGSGTFASTQSTGSCNASRVGLACSFTGTSGTGDRLRYNYTICQANSTTTNTYAIRQSVTTTTYSWSTNALQRVTTTSYSYSVRVQGYTYSTNAYENQTITYYTYGIRQQGYTWSTNAYEDVTTITYKYKVRQDITTQVTTKYYNAVKEVNTFKYTYNSKVKMYQFTSGTPTLISSQTVATFTGEPGTAYSTIYYVPITKVSATTLGNSISGIGWVGGLSGTASYTYSGSKGTAVGVIAMTATENQGSTLDNFSA